MKRRLLVMRHAKSSWKSAAQTDRERPLNGRGRRDAPNVGARIRELGWTPERVLSSDAQRTRETVAGMRDELGLESEPVFSNALYLAGIDALRAAVSELDPDIASVLVLGHNPGWEDAVEQLCGTPLAMKTACVALLSCEADSWPEAMEPAQVWMLEDVIQPREL